MMNSKPGIRSLSIRLFLMWSLLVLCIGFMNTSFRLSTGNYFPPVKLTPEEYRLYTLISDYRKENKLPEVKLSASLTFVAHEHCRDLFVNQPDTAKGCNAHSWSGRGKWGACCYTPDQKNAKCMWEKPRELTNYTGDGFEIACGSSDTLFRDFVMTPEYALQSWEKSIPHNNVILNRGIWKAASWNAIGIGIFKGFAVVWFGLSPDPEGEPVIPGK